MINFEQLRQLILFSKYKTLSRVAEKLFISQPALTRSIQKIEKNSIFLFCHFYVYLKQQKNK